jgi:alpha-tubulin suppressor-like RCC1 family protein
MDDSATSSQLKFEVLKLKEQLDQSKNSYHKIEQQNRDLVKQLQQYIEEAKQANEHLKLFKSSTNDQTSRNLLQALEEEKAKRKQLEKEFESQSSQLMSLMKKYDDPASGQAPSEIYFIENMVLTIENELAQELAASTIWSEKSKDLAMNYRQEITEIQDQYSTALSQLLKESIQLSSPNDSVNNEKEVIFYDIQPDFSDVTNDLKIGEMPENCVKKLKAKYENYLEKIDSRYEEARSSLEAYYQNQITKSNVDKNAISSLASQHNEMLQELKAQNQEIVEEVEVKYMDVLKMINQTLSPKLKDREKMPKLTVTFSGSAHPAGQALAWGSGKDGRCGTGSEEDVVTPFSIFQDSTQIQSLKCGYHHSSAVSTDGKIFTWGRGLFGQLGHGNNEICKNPTQILSLSSLKIVSVSCGWQHTLCLSSSGQVFSWGYGEDGQLGHGDCKDYLIPKEISSLPQGASMISCGHSHSGCISDKKLFMWGCNPDARCFLTTAEPVSSPVKINLAKVTYLDLGVNHSAAVVEDGKVVLSGLAQEGQLGVVSSGFLQCVEHPLFGEKNKAEMVACGDAFTIVLNEKGEVFSFGKAAHGRTGQGNTGDVQETGKVGIGEVVKSISAGCRHSAAVTVNGTLFVWGFNYYHQLGLGDDDKDFDVPVKCPVDKVLTVSCGYFHTMALRKID